MRSKQNISLLGVTFLFLTVTQFGFAFWMAPGLPSPHSSLNDSVAPHCAPGARIRTYVVGSSFSLSCHSMYLAPKWSFWQCVCDEEDREEDVEMLSLDGINPRSNETNPRFSFVKTGFCHYKLKVANVRLSDAGVFNCVTQRNASTVVNVVR